MSNTQRLEYDYWIPIAEWAGSGTVNLAQNDVEYAYNTSTSTTASDTTSFATGPSGATIQIITTSLARAVRFQTPIQASDVVTVEFSENRIDWAPAGSLFSPSGYGIVPLIYDGNNNVGVGLWEDSAVAATDVKVYFSANPAGMGGTGNAYVSWNATSGAFYWRVKKVAGGQAVGFGAFQAASSTNPAGISGLVPALGLPGRTDGVAVAAGYVGERINSTSLSQTATVTANTAVDVSGSALPLTPGVWLVYFMGLFRIRNLSGGSLSVDGAIQLVTNAGVFAGGLFEVAGLQTLTGADTSFTASFAVPIVVAANTTYKLQVINSASAATSIAYFSSGGTFTNDASPLFYGLRIG